MVSQKSYKINSAFFDKIILFLILFDQVTDKAVTDYMCSGTPGAIPYQATCVQTKATVPPPR